MVFLTKEQIAKLAETIRLHASWLTWRFFGSQYITEADLQALKRLGILPMDVQVESIRYAFVLGELEALLKEAEWKQLSFDDLISAAKATQTPLQQLQIEASESSALSVFRGLEEEIKRGVFDKLVAASQKAIDESTIKEKVKDVIKIGLEAHKNYREVAKDLKEDLKGSKRNWYRVADTELHAARQRGVVSAILSGIDVYRFANGVESNVAVVHGAKACEDCLRIYNDPKTGNPKIFKLRELMENAGSNYDRPWRKNAKPVVPPLHPFCRGRLVYVPEGFGWDSRGEFTVVDEGPQDKKSLGELEDMKKSHELLSQASFIPTDEQVSALAEEDIPKALDKIQALKKMHADDAAMIEQLDALELKVLHQLVNIHNAEDQSDVA
jgi:hypothetical protein